jgi:hypothetical protein
MLDVKVKRMRIFFVLRDGGLAATINQGLKRNTYYEDVEFISDAAIDEYIEKKGFVAANINQFINSEGMDAKQRFELLKDLTPDMCSEKERWFDKETGVSKKCESYCPVSEICKRLK